jgi:hypothetical protein
MRRLLLLLLSLTVVFSCFSQVSQGSYQELKKIKQKKIKNYAITGSMVLLAGAADGVNQALMYQYAGFKKVFPHANDQFWMPAKSGANKYKNGDPSQGAKFPGSKTFLVFLTDGYHLTRFTDHLFMSGAVAFKIAGFEKKKWYVYLLEAAGYWLINRVGFSLTYDRFISYP